VGRRILVVVAIGAALSLLSSSAGATDFGGWMISSWSGNTFSGKFKNETASPINGVAVGTALKEGNPITAFSIENLKCQLYAAYGSAFCYVALLIQPGATVAFRGTSKNKLTPAGLQMCSSADKGMDNTCVNVPLSSKGGSVLPVTTTAGGGSNPKAAGFRTAARRALQDVNFALEDEAKAAGEVSTDPSLARFHLSQALPWLQSAAKQNFQSPGADTELHDAINADTHALDWLRSGKPGRLARAREYLDSATAHKNAAVRYLTPLAREPA